MFKQKLENKAVMRTEGNKALTYGKGAKPKAATKPKPAKRKARTKSSSDKR